MEFKSSNGFVVKDTPGSLAVWVDNLFIGEEHVEALREYFNSFQFNGAPSDLLSGVDPETARSAAIEALVAMEWGRERDEVLDTMRTLWNLENLNLSRSWEDFMSNAGGGLSPSEWSAQWSELEVRAQSIIDGLGDPNA